jgi:hypothetical protein
MTFLSGCRLLTAIILSSILIPLISPAQVTIKEKMEIKPKVPLKNQSIGKPHGQLNGSSVDYFNPPLFTGGTLTLGAALVSTGKIDIQGEIDCDNQDVLAVVLPGGLQDRIIAWKGRQPSAAGCNMDEGKTPYYVTLPGGSNVPNIRMSLRNGEPWWDVYLGHRR